MSTQIMWYAISAALEAMSCFIVLTIIIGNTAERKVYNVHSFSRFNRMLYSCFFYLLFDTVRFSLLITKFSTLSIAYKIFCILLSVSYYNMVIYFYAFVREYLRLFNIKTSGVISKLVVVFGSCSVILWATFIFTNQFPGHPIERWFILNGGGYLIIVLTFVELCRYRSVFSRKDFVILSTFFLVPLAASVLKLTHIVLPFVQLGSFFSMLLINNYIHLIQVRLLKKQERELTERKIQLMISQIQPHFIFNVLNSIYVLCTKSEELAANAIDEFAQYLRGNLESLESNKPVSLQQELENVRHYLYLEKMRFGDELDVEYNIQCDNFSIPPLSLQPLVENAVKHGILKKNSKGTVKISSFEEKDCFELTVVDDGVGFDVDAMAHTKDGSTHIGLANVRERLLTISQGKLEISSEPGKGTVVTVKIPKPTDGLAKE